MPDVYTGTDRIDNFFLAHHGIKGQKWGVRRFETQEGYLTPAGKSRYAKYNDGRYDKKTGGDSVRKRLMAKKTKSVSLENRQDIASQKKVKANKWQNADGTLTPEGRKRYEKYAKQMGYGESGSKLTSSIAAARDRLLSTALRNRALGLSISGSKRLIDMSKMRGSVDQSEVNKNAVKMFGGLAATGLIMSQQHAADKRRKFLIKYADAYGGSKGKEIASQAKAGRNTTRAIGVASAGAAILSKLRAGSAVTQQPTSMKDPSKAQKLLTSKRKQLYLTMRR